MKIENLKSLLLLWENLARNRRYAPFVTEDDIKTFRRRAEHEGVTFLTTTLPTLGKAIDTFHSTTRWDAQKSGFKLDSDGLPIFLGKAINFALEGSSVAVDCVRQLSYIFYKLEVDYDEALLGAFLDQFIKTDHDLAGSIHCSLSYKEHVTSMRLIIGKILCDEDPTDIRPCHGSGVTACRTSNHEKYHKLRYYPKLDHFFSYPDYFFYSYSHLADEYEKLVASSESYPRARVALVPKDSRGPRVISSEPAELMYIQQGLMRKLYRVLETHPSTAGQVNFLDQRINRRIAYSSSITGEFATIDLKDASDKVSLALVRQTFPSTWVEALEACRSEETLLPDGRIVKLNKFAPMGSACCFPVEALVFWASARATLQRLGKHNPVFVYGDDIIVSSVLADEVMRDFALIGLSINENKTYKAGPFRESCGGDYHNGYDVTPVRVRKGLSLVGTGLATCADLANMFVAKFGYEDAHPMIRVIEEAVGYTYPRTDLALPCTIRSNTCAVNDVIFKRRYNNDLQRFEHRILTVSSFPLKKQPPNWGELLRRELTRDLADLPRYIESHEISVLEAKLEPGCYVAPMATRKTWVWAWLG